MKIPNNSEFEGKTTPLGWFSVAFFIFVPSGLVVVGNLVGAI